MNEIYLVMHKYLNEDNQWSVEVEGAYQSIDSAIAYVTKLTNLYRSTAFEKTHIEANERYWDFGVDKFWIKLMHVS